jgi:hypothetical protein
MFARIRKCIVAGIGAGIAAYTNGALDGDMTTGEWITVVGSVIVIGVLTWLIPNRVQPSSPVGVTQLGLRDGSR